MLGVRLVDPKTGAAASVTEYGQLVVAPVSYSSISQQTLSVVDTAFLFIEPIDGHNIVITDILISTDKNVGVNGAALEIYTAILPDTLSIAASVLSVEMLKNTSRDLTGLNFIIDEGLWILGKTDDNNAHITVGYYYVPVV